MQRLKTNPLPNHYFQPMSKILNPIIPALYASTVNGWLTTPGQQALLHNDIHDHLTISGVFKRNYNWRVASKLWIYIDRIYRSWHHSGTSGKENPATELNNIEKIMRIRNQPKSTSTKILYQCRYQVNLLRMKKMTIWGNVYYPEITHNRACKLPEGTGRKFRQNAVVQ